MSLLPHKIIQNYMTMSAGDSIKSETNCEKKCVRFCCYYCRSQSLETVSEEDIDKEVGRYFEQQQPQQQQQQPQIVLTTSDSESTNSSALPPDDDSLPEAHSSPILTSRRSATSSTRSSQDRTTESDQFPASTSTISTNTSMNGYSVKGKVEFGLQYNYETGAFEIMVKQCCELAEVDTKKNKFNPYVKVYLLPDKSKSGKRKTSVKKNTLNPVFDKCLKYHMALNSLETRTLWLSVWHSGTFGKSYFLGEVMIPLENEVFDDSTPKWHNLQEKSESMESMLTFKGDILVSLKFVPPDIIDHEKGKVSKGALHVLVKEAKCLTAVKGSGTSDPFCKGYLLPDKGKNSKQKTSIIKKTVNPAWNHTLIYDDVTLQELAERCLELTIWDNGRLGTNTFLGGVRFSLGTGKHYGNSADWMNATGKEVSLWKRMLERPNFWMDGCLSLRPALDQQTSQ